MIQIAADLAKLYTSFMEQKGLETDQHRYYIKWLRYYLDFCHKYKFKRQNKESLSAFLEKLKEKKQADAPVLLPAIPPTFFHPSRIWIHYSSG